MLKITEHGFRKLSCSVVGCVHLHNLINEKLYSQNDQGYRCTKINYMAEHNHTGAFGEEIATAFFLERDYTILEKNWRFAHWEIDIIAAKNKVIHFIEVKTRRSITFGHPEEDVSKRKMRFLMSSAEQYLIKNPKWKLIQFDILAITMLPGKPTEFFLIEDVGV